MNYQIHRTNMRKDELLGMWNSKDFHKIEPLV